jgi:hypothetical protein
MTQGARSTEFWLAVGTYWVGVAVIGIGVLQSRDLLACAGCAVVALASVAYSHGRATTKAPRPYLPPTGRL